MPCLAEQPRQDGSCETREFLGFGHRVEGWGSDGKPREQQEGERPSRHGEFDPVAGEAGGTRYQGHKSGWHMEVGGSRDVQGPRDEGSRARPPSAGAGKWPLCGARREPAQKGITEGFMSTAITRASYP